MKISTKTIQYSIYDRTNGKARYVGDTSSYKRPDLEMLSDTFTGAGLMGEIDLPTLGQIGSMEGEINFNTTNENAVDLFSPKVHEIESRWVTNELNTATGNSGTVAHKEILTILPKQMSLGDVQGNETNESTLTYEVLTYKYIINGKTKIQIDKLNNVFKVNGKDYSEKIREAL